jgi:hypothetical protein
MSRLMHGSIVLHAHSTSNSLAAASTQQQRRHSRALMQRRAHQCCRGGCPPASGWPASGRGARGASCSCCAQVQTPRKNPQSIPASMRCPQDTNPGDGHMLSSMVPDLAGMRAHLRACRYCMPRAQSSAISTARRSGGWSASRRRTRLIRHPANHHLIDTRPRGRVGV